MNVCAENLQAERVCSKFGGGGCGGVGVVVLVWWCWCGGGVGESGGRSDVDHTHTHTHTHKQASGHCYQTVRLWKPVVLLRVALLFLYLSL